MNFYVKKKPDPFTLSECIQSEDTVAPEGYEAMTVEEFDAWKAAELANGWTPQEPEAQ
jgi:hypothetical protein